MSKDRRDIDLCSTLGGNFSQKGRGFNSPCPHGSGQVKAARDRHAVMASAFFLLSVRPDSTSLTALILTPAPSSGYRRWLNRPAVRELLQVPASFLQADTGNSHASRSATSRLLLLVGSTAELERIDVAKLHKQISGACAGAAATKKRSREIVAQTAAQHHKWCPPLSDLRKKMNEAHKSTEACACEEFRVPGAFRRRDEQGQAALRLWRVHPELVPFAEYSVTTPAWPEAPSIIYTDGSATGKNSEDGAAACKTGSGVYRAQPLLELCVDPCGLGPANTITRAELVAIYSNLRHAGPADCVIATDSQASMFMVRNQLTAPGKNAYSAHNLLLAAIAEELTSRAQQGHGTRIIKVKSHTGVIGNEKADGLANAARLPANCTETVDLGNVAHRGQFWPALVKKDTRQMASNLCSGIKAHLGAHARGLANHTQYEGFWDRVLPELHALSFAFWTSAELKDAIRRRVFMVRSGQTWHVGKALQYGRTSAATKGHSCGVRLLLGHTVPREVRGEAAAACATENDTAGGWLRRRGAPHSGGDHGVCVQVDGGQPEAAGRQSRGGAASAQEAGGGGGAVSTCYHMYQASAR